MGYYVVSNPPDYSSAHGDIVCTVYDDNNTQVNYKYVADVYVGDNFITRLKSVPDPVNGLGIFNFGMIYRNYVNSDLVPFVAFDEEILLHEFSYYKLEMHIEWGYEYGTSSEFFDVGIETTRGINITNHYNGRLTSEELTILPYYQGHQVLTNRPYETSMYNAISNPVTAANHALLVGIMYYPVDGYDLRVTYIAYNNNGTTNTVSIRAGIEPSILPGYRYYQLNLSPIQTTYVSSIITSNTKYIIISIENYRIVNPSYTTLHQYKINLKCENRYNPITLIWLNKLGTYDSFTFPKVSKKSYNITKKNYNQLEYFIDESGAMRYFNGQIGNDNKPTYNVNFKESRILNSDIIDEKTYKWLNELLVSPLVYMQYDESSYITGQSVANLIPITIADSTFNFKTKAVERQFNLTLKIEFGDTLNAQYR
jgi:hypothetical protein